MSGDPDLTTALAAFAPERLGFRPFTPNRDAWIKDDGRGGEIVVAPLAWQHAHSPSYLRAGGGAGTGPDNPDPALDALKLLVELQRQVWGMRAEDLVPANLMGLLAETGGSVLAAYDRDRGWNADGWLGFVIGVGSRTGPLVSHMLGVRPDARGTRDIGWTLKILQAHAALRAGHTAMAWTFDPMRGMNAHLNLEKLGAAIQEFTVDKYGVLRTGLYGDVPSDRLTARWDLCSPATWERVAAVAAGTHRPPTPATIASIPELTVGTCTAVREFRPPRLRYRIPGDIDALAHADPAAAIRWRQELRTVFAALTPTKTATISGDPAAGPAAAGYTAAPGEYVIDGFATGPGASGERESFYLLGRRDTA